MEQILRVWLACEGDMSQEEYLEMLRVFKTAEKAVEGIERYLKGSHRTERDNDRLSEEERFFLDHMRPKLLNALDQKISEKELNAFAQSYKSKGVVGITASDPNFPEELREIPEGPAVLFITGNSDLVTNAARLRIAMVGSRNCSDYGVRAAKAISGGLAERGAVIVSGLALGIDTASHQGALEAEGKTIAVLGSGLFHIYPASNRSLFRRIERDGAILSEFPPEMKARPYLFPRRNRIISGISKGVIVVEAGMKSGSLITVDYALAQGKDVFSVPGNINSISSKGTNFLLKQGAKIVLRPSDVLEEYGIYEKDERWGGECESGESKGKGKEQKSSHEILERLGEKQKEIYKILARKPLTFDEMVLLLKKSPAELLKEIVELEMMGILWKQQGRYGLTAFEK